MKHKLNIVATSDLHGYLPKITKSADIMLLAGDVSPLNIQRNKILVWEWFSTDFSEWVKNLPVEKVYMIAGNHDFIDDWSEHKIFDFEKLFDGKLKYLRNETKNHIDNGGCSWSIFGTPYCHIFGSWPHMVSDEYMKELFKEIPDKVDIIISHDPPYGVGQIDCILEAKRWSNQPPEHLGNIPLRNRLEEIDFKLLVAGHIHSGSKDLFEFNSGQCVNVSLLDENYCDFYEPFYYTLEK